MYGIRIPNNTQTSDLQDAISLNRSKLSEKQLQISLNKKYLMRSDDPVSSDEAAIISNNINQNSQWISNINTVQSWEQSTDSILQKMLSSLQRVNELTVEAGDGTQADPGNRKAIAEELDGIIESLVQDANSKYLGTYMFGGTKTDAAPFAVTRDADGKITGVTYQGSESKRSIAVSETATQEYGMIGAGADNIPNPSPPPANFNNSKGLFRFSSTINTGTSETPVWETRNINTFDTLIAFRDAMNSETVPDTLPTTLREAQAALSQITDKVVENATSQQKFNSYETNFDALVKSSTNRLDDVQGLDMVGAITEFNQLQTNLTASLQIVTEINGMSIVNFI